MSSWRKEGVFSRITGSPPAVSPGSLIRSRRTSPRRVSGRKPAPSWPRSGRRWRGWMRRERGRAPASALSSVIFRLSVRCKQVPCRRGPRISAAMGHLGRTISKRSFVRQYQCGAAMRPIKASFSPRTRWLAESNRSSRSCTRFTRPMITLLLPMWRVPHSEHSKLAGASAMRGGLTDEDAAVVRPACSSSLSP